MAEKGGGKEEGVEGGGFAVMTSIGRPVLSVRVSCVMDMGEEVAVVREVMEDEEGMDKSLLRRGVEFDDGLWSWNASAVMRRQRGKSMLSCGMSRIDCCEEIAG